MKLIIPPPVQVAILAFIMWYVGKRTPQSNLSFVFQKELSILLIVTACLITALAIWKMFSLKTTVNPLKPGNASQLVTNGIFSLSRNPIYVADFMLLLAWLIWLGNPINLVPLFIFLWYITIFQIKPEEQALSQLFGNEFEDYCRRVRRWL